MTAPARRRVFVDHGEAYGNLGDEAMLLSALRRLEARLGPCVFTIPREGDRPMPVLDGFVAEHVSSPFAFFMLANERLERMTGRLARHGVAHPPSLARRVWFARWLGRAALSGLWRDDRGLRAAVQALRNCEIFYGVGAADFNDFNAFGAAYKSWLYELARPYVKVMAVSAQGFGPLENAGLHGVMRRAFGNLDLLTFRDHAFSADFTRGLGPLPCRTRIVGDEAFSLAPADAEARDRYLAAAGLAPGEAFVAVHWRSTDYVRETEPLYPRIARIFEAAEQAHRARIVFFPMSYDIHSRHDDECCDALRRHMKDPARMLMAPKSRDLGIIKAAIGASRFTLGLSYHVHVFGLSQGVPAIIVYSNDYYRYKSEGLVGFYAPPNAAIDVGAEDGEAAALRAIEDLARGYREVRDGITRRNAEIRAVNDWTIEELAGPARQRTA